MKPFSRLLSVFAQSFLLVELSTEGAGFVEKGKFCFPNAHIEFVC